MSLPLFTQTILAMHTWHTVHTCIYIRVHTHTHTHTHTHITIQQIAQSLHSQTETTEIDLKWLEAPLELW